MERKTVKQKKCGTCMFWGGMRTPDIHGNMVEYYRESEGYCIGGGRDKTKTQGDWSCSSWKQGFGKGRGDSAQGIHRIPGSLGEGVDTLAGGIIIGLLKLVWFIIKLLFAGIIFPFITLPRYLFRRGKIGRILLGIYVLLWVIGIWVFSVGPDVVSGYISSNLTYLIIMASPLIICPVLCVIFKIKKIDLANFKRNILIIIGSGLVIIVTTFCIGYFGTKDLANVPEKNIYAFVNIEELSVHSGPSTENDVITNIKKDSKIQIFNETKEGDWVKIKYNNFEGYVNETFLRNKKYDFFK